MSQEKVDRYKEEKKNRKADQSKDKSKSILGKVCGGVIVAALVAWLGYSAVVEYDQQVNGGTVLVNTSALDEYTSEMTAE